MRISWLCCIVAVALLATIPLNSEDPQPRVGTLAELAQLTDQERMTYYRLSEGSENFPLSWMRALISVNTQKPFMDNMARFGLIEDLEHPENLPLGITVDQTRDTNYLKNFLMVGVNCAACHTAEFKYKGSRFVVDGAPGKFDLSAYYEDLFGSAKQLLQPSEFISFFNRVYNNPAQGEFGPAPNQFTAMSRVTAEIQASSELDNNAASNAYDAEFLSDLEQQLSDELASFQNGGLDAKLDIRNNLAVAPESTGVGEITSVRTLDAGEIAKLSSIANVTNPTNRHDFKKLQTMSIDEGSELAHLDSSPINRLDKVRRFAQNVKANFLLFLARLQFLKTLAESHSVPTVAGYGRLDAFDNARNLLWPESPVNANAPVSYPDLWTFQRTDYLHWDANTTSVMKRNIGQALGLGAVLNRKSFVSTIDPRHLHSLELLARKLHAPAWPEDVFGAVDIEKFKRGAMLFKVNCASCHDPTPPQEILMTPAQVNTDNRRAANFAKVLNGQSYAEEIASLTTSVRNRAYKDSNVTPDEAKEFDGRQPSPGKPEWRTTKAYAARPLQGVWATAPYLHNNSVLNLWQLLLPASKRLKAFYAGCTEYDPVDVGFVSDAGCQPGQPQFQVDKVGNSNAGHEYGTHLTESERRDLLEFLKAY